MTERPNPSGFRVGRTFINLAEVVSAKICGADHVVVVRYRGSPESNVEYRLGYANDPRSAEAEATALLDALELYHSKR